MSISDYITLQSTITFLLSLLGKKLENAPNEMQNAFNFLFTEPDGRKVAIDVRSRVPVAMLDVMADKLSKTGLQVDTFVTLTPYAPDKEDKEAFRRSYAGVAKNPMWLSPQEFVEWLGLSRDFDITSPAAIEKLRAASVSANVLDSETAPAKPSHEKGKPAAGKSKEAQRLNELMHSIEKGERSVDPELLLLSRKMPHSILRSYHASGRAVEDFFNVGSSTRDVIVVLSDIINFSQMVRAAYPADLNEAMFRYYREAQKFIYDCGGVLDKFIGDSVLAVFNFPEQRSGACADAIRFCAFLVQAGRQIFSTLQGNIDEKIDTGTRVGVAMGEIWTLNIGLNEVDLTFVGDKINLAARLEKNCRPDGALLSNIVARRLAEEDRKFFAGLKPEKRELEPTEVKGQERTIITWQVDSAGLGSALSQNDGPRRK